MARYRNNRVWYYTKSIVRMFLPGFFLKNQLKRLEKYDKIYVLDRVNYYNKIEREFKVSSKACSIKNYKMPERSRAYYFDSQKYLRFFNRNLLFDNLWGDITYIPNHPAIVKSRPIAGDNSNSILLKINRLRHYLFVKDELSFQEKKDMVVWRGATLERPHRDFFLKIFQNHPLFNIGKIDPHGENQNLIRPRLSIKDQLQYKFIMSIEGNDVATNLKWIMSSNSLCFMIKPKFETWFMEGRLIPNYHYVLLKDDYSDIEEKIAYYSTNTEEALQIIKQAHEYIDQFRDHKREDLISLLVLKKYFEKSGQL